MLGFFGFLGMVSAILSAVALLVTVILVACKLSLPRSGTIGMGVILVPIFFVSALSGGDVLPSGTGILTSLAICFLALYLLHLVLVSMERKSQDLGIQLTLVFGVVFVTTVAVFVLMFGAALFLRF